MLRYSRTVDSVLIAFEIKRPYFLPQSMCLFIDIKFKYMSVFTQRQQRYSLNLFSQIVQVVSVKNGHSQNSRFSLALAYKISRTSYECISVSFHIAGH